jgi:beta-phosphoglucomutase-like phosphatase (HAD superfamily)
MTLNKYDLIIFDCDGTLVDSEYLNNKASADALNDFGLTEYTPEKCLHDFAGVAWQEIKQILEARHNIEIPQALIDDYVARVQIALSEEDIAIQGAKDFVSFCDENYKICVGSNGERSNVFKALELQGFKKYFIDEHIFTKIQVENPKPAPDLFLYAAEKMGTEPSRCLVIEDSYAGAKAGVAAGMDVFGFTGVAHDKEYATHRLTEAGVVDIFDDFIHMRDALRV